MADPNWNNGFYYDSLPPHTGMKLARRMFFSLYSIPYSSRHIEIATITYRSGPEWDLRFGRQLRPTPEPDITPPGYPRTPALCPDFLIETYLDHQVRQTGAKAVSITNPFLNKGRIILLKIRCKLSSLHI